MNLEIEEIARKKSCQIFYIKAGDIIREGNLCITCLHPADDYLVKTNNGYSVVLSVNYKEFDMLLTGDLEVDGEDLILESFDKGYYDVLKVAHHGSKFSTGQEFLRATNPDYALISCGENNIYGHPHEELLDRLNDIGSEVIITYDSGAITLMTDGKSMVVENYLK